MTNRALSVRFLEPWYGGSHRAFLDAWQRHTGHSIEVHGLGPRHWSWRQESSAWELARALRHASVPDVVACSGYVDLPRLMGFLGPAWSSTPALVYLHETQFTYPGGTEHGTGHAFSNVLSCLRANALVFNSEFHRDDFGAAADALLARLPRPNPRAELREALASACVIPPCPELAQVPLGEGAKGPLRVVFPHRPQPEKNPLGFLRAAARAAAAGADLQIVLLGGDIDGPELRAAVDALGSRVVFAGFAQSRSDYLAHLGSSDVVVSTAQHEFFGVAVCEAMAAGCTPLLPDRLNYPDLCAELPADGVLYSGEGALTAGLIRMAERPGALRAREVRRNARTAVLRFDAEPAVRALDALVEALVEERASGA